MATKSGARAAGQASRNHMLLSVPPVVNQFQTHEEETPPWDSKLARRTVLRELQNCSRAQIVWWVPAVALQGRCWAQSQDTGEASVRDDKGDEDKDMQDLLVDLLRLETGKVRVNEFVEDRSKFLTEIAEQANEEFDRIAEEAKKNMDEAGSKVVEQIDAEAADFEEELAAPRAEMEANEREFNEFEKNVENAGSQNLIF